MSSRAAALIIFVSALWFWAVFLSMHVLEPEFSPLRAPGSAYVLGAYGGWMTTTYFALSAALLGAGFGVAANVPRSAVTRIACAAFVIAAVGAVLAGLFPMDFPGPPRTMSGRLHLLGGAFTFPAWVLGTLLFSLSIRRDRRWARRSGMLFALAVVCIGTLAVLLLSVGLLGFGGYAQRLLIGLLFAWMIVAALHLVRSSAEDGGSQPNGPLQPMSGAGASG